MKDACAEGSPYKQQPESKKTQQETRLEMKSSSILAVGTLESRSLK
jgi:hypothetical protein